MRCMACYQEVSEGQGTCPRCGFVQYQVIGDAKEARSTLERMAEKHRESFLRRFDLGISIFTWKDQDGTVVLDQKKRLSFGAGDSLLGRTVWMEQQFARIPDERELTVELSALEEGSVRIIPIRIPVPQERQLQTLGIEMSGDLKVRLLLRNGQTQTCSGWVDFL